MADDAPFLSRWSRRKALARQGQPLAEPPPPPPGPAPAAPGPAAGVPARALAPLPPPPPAPAPDAAAAAPSPAPAAAPPAPTLDDVARLPADAADYSRFVARGVQPEVKNAALKKLFSDPHFNVMDGLDIYIDDYSKPDPLPAAMLRQMVQSRFLGLFDDEDEAATPAGAASAPPGAALPADQPDTPADAAPTAARLAPPADPVPAHAPAALPHEDADLRLQPHPAAGPESAAAGAEPAPGRQY